MISFWRGPFLPRRLAAWQASAREHGRALPSGRRQTSASSGESQLAARGRQHVWARKVYFGPGSRGTGFGGCTQFLAPREQVPLSSTRNA